MEPRRQPAWALLLALALCLLTKTLWAAPPTYPCYQPAGAPVVDGEVAGDPAWRTIPIATGFSVLGGGYTYAKQTAAQIAWTEEGLFFGVVCEEPDAKSLKPQIPDGGDTWAEDGIEIFIQPARGDVYQFAITAGGAKGGFEGHPDITKIKAAAQIKEAEYALEVFIPWSVIGATKPREGEAWRGNVCRNIFTTKSGGDKFTCWAPLQARFLEPENFAFLVFYERTLAEQEAREATETLNKVYRQTLEGQVAQAVRDFAAYRQALQEAALVPAFAEQAKRLLAEWQTLEAIHREKERASLKQIRQGLRQLEALNRESYEIKYRYLIQKLLQEE